MGMAFANSFIQYNLVQKADLLLVEKNQERGLQLQEQKSGIVVDTISSKISQADLIILSVKPQDYPAVSLDLKSYLKKSQVVLSIMAGIPIAQIQSSLSHDLVIRAMPNTPAVVGLSATAMAVSHTCDDVDRTWARTLLQSIGIVVEIDEAMLDAFTGLIGSGPAYVFYFLEAMTRAGTGMGLTEQQAHQLAVGTFVGASELARRSDEPPAVLRQRVTSKGGTTYAALQSMEAAGVAASFEAAMRAAEQRAHELGDEFGS